MNLARNQLVVIAIVLGLAQAGLLVAQACPGAPENFRSELETFVKDLEELYPPLDRWDPSLKPGLQPAVEELDGLIDTLSVEQLEEICGVFARYPELRDTPALVAGVMPSMPPLEGSSGSCLALSREAYLALFIATEILEAAAVATEAVCNALACPIYTGAIVCAPTEVSCSVVCPATMGVLKILYQVSESFLIEDNHCGLTNHYAVAEDFAGRTETTLDGLEAALQNDVLPPLDARVSTRASQAGLDLLQAALEGDLLATEASLDGILTELAAQASDEGDFQRLDRRLRIEESLQEGEPGPISTFQLPEFLGGQIELVREVVAEAILMNEAVGEDMTRALQYFTEGDLALNRQDYERASRAYREAYLEAAEEQRPSIN